MPPDPTIRPDREGAERRASVADLLFSAEGGICDDMDFPHAHGGFCTNWRLLAADAALSKGEG